MAQEILVAFYSVLSIMFLFAHANTLRNLTDSSVFSKHLEPLTGCEDCVIALQSGDVRWASPSPIKDMQKIYANMQKQNDVAITKKQRNLIILYHGDDMSLLENLVSLLSSVDHRMFIYLGNARPADGILLDVTRPFAWVTSSLDTKVC